VKCTRIGLRRENAPKYDIGRQKKFVCGRVTIFQVALDREILQYKSTPENSSRLDFQQYVHKKRLAAGLYPDLLGSLPRLPSCDRARGKSGGKEKGGEGKERRKGKVGRKKGEFHYF